MAKQNLNVGTAANDGTGDTLRDGAIKLNSVIDEIYSSLGNDTNLQIGINAPLAGQVLRWNGSVFAEGHFDQLSADLNVGAFKIVSEDNGNIVVEPNGTGDIDLKAGSQGSRKVYIDGDDGYLKYVGDYANVAGLPSAADHHGMFAHAHDPGNGYFAHGGNWIRLLDVNDGISALTDVDTTVNGGPSDGQVLKWNDTNSAWEPANDLNEGGGGGGTTQNLFETIDADTGTTTASAANDTLTIAGGTNISTSITGDTVTINMTGTLGDPDQNVFVTLGADNGTRTATTTTDTINFVGGTGVETNLNANNLTITNTSPNVVQNVIQTINDKVGGSYTAASDDAELTITGSAAITTSLSGSTLTIDQTTQYKLPSASEGQNVIYGVNQWEAVASPTLNIVFTAASSSDYTLNGAGFSGQTDPTIYVYRGFTYRFENNAPSHPLAIRQSNGGSAVSGVTGSQTGIQFWTVPMSLSAGTTYVYQCTIHSNMVGNIVVV